MILFNMGKLNVVFVDFFFFFCVWDWQGLELPVGTVRTETVSEMLDVVQWISRVCSFKEKKRFK